MRLMSFTAGGAASWGVVEGRDVVDLGSRAPSLRAALPSLPGLATGTEGLPRHALHAPADSARAFRNRL